MIHRRWMILPFWRYLLKDDLRALYHSIDLAVLINTGYDLSARAMGEAFSAGVPVLALDSADPSLKLRRAALLEGAAAISPLLVTNSEQLASVITDLLANKSLLSSFGVKAKDFAAKRTLANECAATMVFYRQIAKI